MDIKFENNIVEHFANVLFINARLMNKKSTMYE